MDNRPLTPQEILEERRLWRYWCRWYQRHHHEGSVVLYGTLGFIYLEWVRFEALKEFIDLLAQRSKNLINAAKFCNGLTGVSLTDGVTPAS